MITTYHAALTTVGSGAERRSGGTDAVGDLGAGGER
jgi:hypothetical protein